MHGYEIASSIQRTSDGVLQVEEGSSALRYDDAHQRLGDCQVGYDGWQPQCSVLSVDSGRTQTAHSRDDSMRRVIGAITHLIEAV
jgi:hypothetical protein